MRCCHIASIAFVALIAVGCQKSKPIPPSTTTASATTSAPSATWPWSNAEEKVIATGLTRWHATAEDGTSLELFRVVLHPRSPLSIGLEDLDRFDDKPFDNLGDYKDFGVESFRTEINNRSRSSKIQRPSPFGGHVALIWNGPFFIRTSKNGFGSHIGPVVFDGKKRYNVGTHRWTFGWKNDGTGQPTFKILHMPKWETLESEFTYAVDGLQCLVRWGKPLNLPPPTDPIFTRPRGGVSSTPQDVGAIPIVDDIKTSRTSIGWSHDNQLLYVLIVSEPDTETASINAFRRGEKQTGGWNIADLQQFWMKLGVWGAVNSDGGMQTQRTFVDVVPRQVDGSTYSDFTIVDYLSPQLKGPARNIRSAITDFKPIASDGGGTLMAFYIYQRDRHPHENFGGDNFYEPW